MLTSSSFKLRSSVILAFVLTLLLSACGDNIATPTSATTTAATPTTASATVNAGTEATANNSGDQPSVFRIGLIPNQNPDTVKAQYSSFKTYMEKTLGIPVELYVPQNYAAVVQSMVKDQIDMAYFGGLTYVQAKQQADIYPIVTEIDNTTDTIYYTSVIIVPANSPIKNVADIKGKSFAFGDISSTSGSLYPRIMLDQAGITVPQDLKEVKYTGGHDLTAKAVQDGVVDAGGLEERILNRLIATGKIDKTKIRIIKQSDPIPGYPWVVRSTLNKTFVTKVIAAFQNIKDPDLLKQLNAEGYGKVSDRDYEYVREQAQKFGLLKMSN
jgi:phosphonate transport system substrate-binding protein